MSHGARSAHARYALLIVDEFCARARCAARAALRQISDGRYIRDITRHHHHNTEYAMPEQHICDKRGETFARSALEQREPRRAAVIV